MTMETGADAGLAAEPRAKDVVAERGDLRARDVLRELAIRPVLCERLVRRIDSRAWDPPRFAKGQRIFERCGLPDPWNPSVEQGELGIGDVGLAGRKLPASGDPSRRQPAPHAQPPGAPAAPSGAPRFPPGFQPPSVPSAPPKGKPAPRIGETRADDTAQLRKAMDEKSKRKVSERSAEATRVRVPLKNLPVRPDMPTGAPGSAPPPAQTSAAVPVRAPLPGPAPTRLVPRGTPPESAGRPESGGGSRPPQRPGSPVAPRVAMASTRAAPPSGPVELPMAPPPQRYASYGDDREDAAGPGDLDFTRGRPRPVEEAEPVVEIVPPPPTIPRPVSAPVARPVATEPARPPAPASGPPSGPPRAPPKPGGGNLDDLFGMGGGETRIRLGASTEEPRPRRPRVTDPSAVPGGIDRRPPPPKPPVVVPMPGPGAPSRDDDPPDE